MNSSARGVYRGQITKLVKTALDYLKSSEAQATTNNAEHFDIALEELNSLVSRLRAANINLQKVNEVIAATLKPEDGQREYEVVSEYDDKIADVESRLTNRIDRMKKLRDITLSPTQGHASRQEMGVVKLPKLELKKFSGNSGEWLPFWEQFKALVHENNSLSASDRFSYLQSVLCGKAANTIAGFSPTAECYDAAIALLQEEYGDKEKLIDKHIHQLMNLCPVTAKGDAVGLRRLYNAVIANTRSLTALGIPSNSYYVMLKTVILRCLPYDLRVQFHRKCDFTETSIEKHQSEVDGDGVNASTSISVGSELSFAVDKGVERLLHFIKAEIESLERAGGHIKESRQNDVTSNIRPRTAAGLLTPSDGKAFCIFCKTNDHFSGNCGGKLTLNERKEVLKREGRCFKCMRRGHTSRNCNVKNIHCSKCKGRHMYAMCDPNYFGKQNARSKGNMSSDSVVTNLYSPNNCNVYLQTACALASSPLSTSNRSFLIRIVIDSGSQRSFVKESIARDLNLPIIDRVKIKILPFGASRSVPVRSCNRVKVCLRNLHSGEMMIVAAVVVPEICVDNLPIPNSNDARFTKYHLADSHHMGLPIDGISMLIGSDYYWKIVSGEFQRISDSLTAVNTKLGWTIQGPETDERLILTDVAPMYSSTLMVGDFTEEDLSKMWDLETLGITPPVKNAPRTDEEISRYVEYYENRYTVSLLWLSNHPPLDSYFEGARQRFSKLVRKLSREPRKLEEYDTAMRELISSGVAEPVADLVSKKNLIYYIPHRPVYRYDKTTTQLRIVFDASAHSTDNVSLNDCLETGPNLLPEILSTLLNFRQGSIALIADIEKAFLQISLSAADKDVHRFFWFSEPMTNCLSLPAIKEFRMTRVTFGVKCSPFLLGAVIQNHLAKESPTCPEVCELLKKSFYMDDLVTSVNDLGFAKRVYTETRSIMMKASMNVRKWNTNDPALRQILGTDADLPTKQKVLGVLWCSVPDEIAVDMEPALSFISRSLTEFATKRMVLQLMAHIYDPLGILSPFVIKMKIFFQELWRRHIPWDEPLPLELLKTWKKCCLELSTLKDTFIPRALSPFSKFASCQLHVFADASPAAYGVVAYLRVRFEGKVTTGFVCAKTRVAPLKGKENDQLTLPKLELTAALIASRLFKYISDNTSIEWSKAYLWSDSRIALCWINGDIRRWNSYVSNRVREIHQYSSSSDWHFCPGELNPADFLTKGVFGKNVSNSEFWLNGPDWLREDMLNWPQTGAAESYDPVLFSSMLASTQAESDCSTEALFDMEKFSSYMRLLRVTAYVQRYARKLRKTYLETNKFLKNREVQLAEIHWIKFVQQMFYGKELRLLKLGKPISNDSSILTLNPILDDDEVLRVGTRLQCMDTQYENIFPAILPRSCYLAKLIILDAHERSLHGGVNITLCRVREKFWIPRARQLIKALLQKCRVCRRLFSKPISQPFAPLPKHRLMASKAFQTVGVDFAGPLYAKSPIDSTKTNKVYIMLFTCAVVRAIHLELIPNMTLESCLLALRRFIARRGTPRVVISDNARTFKRAAKELRVLGDIICADEFQSYVTSCRISWEFIVERAAWWGGFWERLVRSTKNILKLTIGKACLSSEELHTVLVEAESVINSRPLTYINDDPKDLIALTPSHFLSPSVPLISATDEGALGCASEIRQLWKRRAKLTKTFWKRWRLEYVQLLRSFHQAKGYSADTIKEGDVVLLQDSSAPRLLWKLALIDKVFPGRDGKIRSCIVRTSNGSYFKRPVQLLYPLEVTDKTTPEPLRGAEDVENPF